jgi:hypothetical protein
LQHALTLLSPQVRGDEAGYVSQCAYDYPRILAAEYRVVRPALCHNILVNTGLRTRGLCYEWTEDLLSELQSLKLQSLELHWGIARAETFREHNCLVVTAVGQPFEQGIALDAWRRGGALTWALVREDRYPWVKVELTNSVVALPLMP